MPEFSPINYADNLVSTENFATFRPPRAQRPLFHCQGAQLKNNDTL